MNNEHIVKGNFFEFVTESKSLRLSFVDDLVPPDNLHRRMSSFLPTARDRSEFWDWGLLQRFRRDGDSILFGLAKPCRYMTSMEYQQLICFMCDFWRLVPALCALRYAEQAFSSPETFWEHQRRVRATTQLSYFRRQFERDGWGVGSSIYRTLLAHWDEDSLNDALMEYAFERI